MAKDRKSTSFKQDWWDNIQEYLKEHPEEGFSPKNTKEFIKNVVNKYTADQTGLYTKKEIKMLKDMSELED